RVGRCADGIAAFLIRQADTPDVTASRVPGRVKLGGGLNVEQEVSALARAFGRIGWSDGAYESFAYTEVDNSVALGADLRGAPWHPDGDKLGLAAASNGLGDAHRPCPAPART